MKDTYHANKAFRPDFRKSKLDGASASNAGENLYKSADGKHYSSLKDVKDADDAYFDKVSPK